MFIIDPLHKRQTISLSKKSRTRTNKKKIPGELNQTLVKYASFQNDEWWQNKILEVAEIKSKGKIVVKDNEVVVKKGAKSKESFYFDENIDDEIMAFRFVEFLKTYALIYSPSDEDKIAQNDLPKESPEIWTKLKKDEKEMYIANFIDEERRDKNFTEKEAISLYHAISLLIDTGRIDKSSFTIRDGKIVSIESLKWNPEQRCYVNESDEIRKRSKTSKKKVDTCSPYSKRWQKYISTVQGRSKKDELTETTEHTTEFTET